MPGPHKKYAGKVTKVSKNTILNFGKRILKYKFRLILVLIMLFLSTIITVSISLYIQVLIDKYIMTMLDQKSSRIAVDYWPLIRSLITYASILLFGVICTIIQRYVNLYMAYGILRDLRVEMFVKMQKLPISYFDTNQAGDIMSLYTNDIDTLREVIAESIPMSITSIVTFVTIIICMFSISINLFLIVLITTLGMLFYTKIVSKKSVNSYVDSQRYIGELNGYVEEMVNGAKEVKVFSYEKRNVDNFNEKNNKWKKSTSKADVLGITMMPIMNASGNLLYVLIACIGGYMAINYFTNISLLGAPIITLGMIASFLSFTKSFTQQIAQLSSQLPFIFQSLSGAERIFTMISQDEEENEGYITLVNAKIGNGQLVESDESTGIWAWKDKTDISNIKYTKLEGRIEFNNVNFSYVKDKKILKNINIKAEPGEKIALVGATGSGKTTIINLLNRFYDIEEGTITYDGIDIKRIDKISLRESIALVLQDVHLFTGTIMDNIRYGRLDATDQECIEAAKLVGADKFISELEDGYDTMLKGEGESLSQGQRQLLSIARAAVADPPVMVLDEATSSIDTRTEKLVQDGMDSIMKGRTVFVIAHRLSTIKNSDIIIVISGGEIIEMGNHKTLLEKGGVYYQLYTGKLVME